MLIRYQLLCSRVINYQPIDRWRVCNQLYFARYTAARLRKLQTRSNYLLRSNRSRHAECATQAEDFIWRCRHETRRGSIAFSLRTRPWRSPRSRAFDVALHLFERILRVQFWNLHVFSCPLLEVRRRFAAILDPVSSVGEFLSSTDLWTVSPSDHLSFVHLLQWHARVNSISNNEACGWRRPLWHSFRAAIRLLMPKLGLW